MMYLIIIVITILITAIAYDIYHFTNNNVYISKYDGHKALIKGDVMFRDSLTDELVACILYVDLYNGYFYTRNSNLFFQEFIKLEEWKKEN